MDTSDCEVVRGLQEVGASIPRIRAFPVDGRYWRVDLHVENRGTRSIRIPYLKVNIYIDLQVNILFTHFEKNSYSR